jgi:predicted nucleotidyltransferase
MDQSLEKSHLEQVAELLLAHGVRFIVIGGQAESLMGSPRVTYDVDLCYERTPDNLQRLADALKKLNPALRGVPPGLPFIIDARALALGSNFTFTTMYGDLDLLGYVEPLGNFESIDKRATTERLGSLNLRVIDLEDLIKVKEHIRRSKDQDSLFQLYAIRRIRGEQDKTK